MAGCVEQLHACFFKHRQGRFKLFYGHACLAFSDDHTGDASIDQHTSACVAAKMRDVDG